MFEIPRVILFIESSREYGRQLLRGISRYATVNGPWSFIFETEWTDEHLAGTKKRAGGIIAHIRNTRTAEIIRKLGIPAVVSAHTENIGSEFYQIKADSKAIGKMAAEHFLEKGFNNFAFCGMSNIWHSEERGQAFKKMISQDGARNTFYSFSLGAQKNSRSRKKEVQNSLTEWLLSMKLPVGIFASNDDCAEQIVEACKEVQLRVPEEVAILGVDNDEFVCNFVQPPLSSIAINAEVAGYEAAALLDKLMFGRSIRKTVITVKPTHVVTRQSTDIMAIHDPEICKALHFIRRNANRPIGVPKVVDAVLTSRRALERKFRQTLGRSVNDQIRKIRTEQIAKLLIDTNLTISEIAHKMGFHRIDHICRYFKREFKVTPREFREQYCLTKGAAPPTPNNPPEE